MNKEDGRKKQPFNEIDTECLDYIVNELKNNKSMQQMLNYYKGKYYSERYWELKKQVDKAIEYIKSDDGIKLFNSISSRQQWYNYLLSILEGKEVKDE